MSDPLLDGLQQHLAAGGNVQDALAGLAQSELGQTDPALGLLSQFLARREQTLERDLEVQENEEDRLEARARLEEVRRLEEARQLEEAQRQERRRARLERLRLRLEELEDDLAACQARLDELALALGACPSCWGEDAGCRLCRGRGRPGFLRPDPEAFRRWIVPALPEREGSPPTGGAAAPERTAL
ncbi:hypothetical protein [Deinococcus metallilatus]|nr:hypothetical protein [Deinococcus metallilatus]GMA15731.1 hypothetical protein GCM10025871_20620 [Deinococcus metallilatus]